MPSGGTQDANREIGVPGAVRRFHPRISVERLLAVEALRLDALALV